MDVRGFVFVQSCLALYYVLTNKIQIRQKFFFFGFLYNDIQFVVGSRALRLGTS